MKRILMILMLATFAVTGCSFWKSTTLNPKRFAFIKNGSKPGQAVVKIDEYGMEDLSIGINVLNGMVCVADNELRRVQVMKPNGDVKLIIGSVKKMKEQDIPAENFNFGSIGFVAMDDDDNLFVQNKFSQIRDNDREKSSGGNSIDFAPSYIVVFNKNGELQYTLGQKGATDTPFSHIERIYVDSNGKLFVISRSTDSWSIFSFKGKHREQSINLSTMEFRERDGENVFEGKIDNIRVFSDGKRLLISVSFYQGLRLKYIKIFEYIIATGKVDKTFMEIPDPKNVLFDIIDDKYIYLWNVSNGDVKFEVANLDGTVINNVYLELKNKRDYYSRIILDNSGKIFSYHITKGGVEISKWE
jgi:hypothetical protein